MRRFIWIAGLLMLGAGLAQAEEGAEATVRANLERYVRDRVGDGSAVIELPRLSVFSIDRGRNPGALRTEFSSRSREPFRGRVPITVALYAGDRLVKKNIVSPYVHVTRRVVAVNRDLRRGEVLGLEDMAYVERDETRVQRDAIESIDEAIGLRMKRSLREGWELRRSHIEGVPLIDRGDRVLLILESGALKIQAIGRSKEAGAIGEWIRVMNLDSKRELSGRVDRDGRVHVAF